jgi:hypothetical protein
LAGVVVDVVACSASRGTALEVEVYTDLGVAQQVMETLAGGTR